MLANKQKCSCFKSIRILTLLRVPLWIIKIGLVRFWSVTLRAGLEIMTRWAFALLLFLWNVKVGMRVLIFFWMCWCLWEALLTFYGVVIGNGKMALYIYIIYINIYYTYSPILYFSYHPHRSWQELLWLKGFWVLIKTLFMTVFIISLNCIL